VVLRRRSSRCAGLSNWIRRWSRRNLFWGGSRSPLEWAERGAGPAQSDRAESRVCVGAPLVCAVLSNQGRHAEAYVEIDRAYRLDPSSPIINNNVGVTPLLRRRLRRRNRRLSERRWTSHRTSARRMAISPSCTRCCGDTPRRRLIRPMHDARILGARPRGDVRPLRSAGGSAAARGGPRRRAKRDSVVGPRRAGPSGSRSARRIAGTPARGKACARSIRCSGT